MSSLVHKISHEEWGKCSECGASVLLETTQIFSEYAKSRLHWYSENFFCENCMMVSEPQGINDTPLKARGLLLDVYGVWQLDVSEDPPQREKLLMILLEQKRILGFETTQKLPPISGIVAIGTFAEMKVLQLYLLEAEIPSTLTNVK